MLCLTSTGSDAMIDQRDAAGSSDLTRRALAEMMMSDGVSRGGGPNPKTKPRPFSGERKCLEILKHYPRIPPQAASRSRFGLFVSSFFSLAIYLATCSRPLHRSRVRRSALCRSTRSARRDRRLLHLHLLASSFAWREMPGDSPYFRDL